MVVSYVVVDKQCAWQQDRSPDDSDGPNYNVSLLVVFRSNLIIKNNLF